MATREDIGGSLEGFHRFDALTQEIENKFSHFHSLLETRRVSLLERVKKMRDLYQQHQDLSEAIKQLEGMRNAANEMLKGNFVVGDKDDIVQILDGRVQRKKGKKSDLELISNQRFLDNSDEFTDCVKRMHLRGLEAVEYCKRREPLIMKGKRGYGEREVIVPYGMAIDVTSDEVFVVDFYNSLVCVYSSEGELVRKFGEEQLNGPYGICLFGKFLFVSSFLRSVIYKFAKTGEFVKSTSLEGENAIQLENPTGMCVYL